MTYYIQAMMLTFVEALCCHVFFDTFLNKKGLNKWAHRGFFLLLFVGFIGVSFLPSENYVIKATASILLIGIIAYMQYRSNWIQTIFLAIGYYGLVICIDRIMLVIIQFAVMPHMENLLNDPIKTTIIALLCKTILFLIIIFINRTFKLNGSINLIPGREWLRFLFFPVITIICMSAFAMEGETAGNAVLITSFVLVLSNFIVFYMIRDVVTRERSIQEMRVSQERIRSQTDMYHYMEGVYEEQRKKTHEFKNHLGCLLGLMKAQNYRQAETYIEGINDNWIEELDYINTNNVIVNSILNQKYKQAKKLGIPIVFSFNDLKNIPMKDEDVVTLLSNLLDNAIEACEKITNGTRVIKLHFFAEKGKLTIIVRNPIAEPLKYSGKKVVTTKEDTTRHGIGLINIQNVVNKYGGENIWSCNGGYFTHSVVINY